MQFSVVSFASAALLAAALVAAQSKLTVNSNPSITTCVPNRLTWTGGAAPYNVFIIKPLHPEDILDSLGSTSDTFKVYTPNGKTTGIQVGDQVAVYVVDSQGVNSGSAGVNVISGGSCSGSSSGSGASGSDSSSSSAAAAPTAAATSASMTTSRSNPTRSDSSSASAPAASTSTGTNTGAAAPGLKVSGGLIAGVVGVLAAALI
ncbi:hypothetical protein OC834_002793 [Tilletia horrida]|uniref:Uncharacterized protein n=1 Tax=Tilletia horrida TaxID=155126 RepID=A0AAN6JL32_9BASI|nr:hypothetical protein OC835_005251 [Tilletia horrida]KAK0531878.1 hypothetical protein OC834_002793 [Tilletia horrida]KAK0533156.1 hypothetical protein OC842_003063 [Tilletia horrida]KAK0560297.1 hypothetical protein OC844_003859 [Tilletia horrida]